MSSQSPFRVVLLKHGYPDISIERETVEKGGGVLINAEDMSDADALRECATADAILVRWMRLGAPEMAGFSRCKIIVRYGVGTDNVDIQAASQARILVGHAPNYCMDEVSNHTIALWMACVRRVTSVHRQIQAGGWDINPSFKMERTRGTTFGLVGFGNIGQAVARKLSGWGMRLIATDPFVDAEVFGRLGVEKVDLDTLCRESDHVSLHVPLLPETRHLANQAFISKLKPGAILVNTARGPVLEASALKAGLDSGRVVTAGVDVFEEEPLPVESWLRSDPRVVLSDHVAWYSEASQRELKRTVAEEAVAVCRGGLPRSLANPELLVELGRAAEWTPNSTARWQQRRMEWLKQGSGTVG